MVEISFNIKPDKLSEIGHDARWVVPQVALAEQRYKAAWNMLRLSPELYA